MNNYYNEHMCHCHEPINDNHMNCECCCSHMFKPTHQPPPPMHKSNGWVEENIFTIINNIPCVVDSSCIKYGQLTSVSENVMTKIAQRHEDSCINLSATFDMTESINTNITLLHFLTQLINNQYKTLKTILPIVKSTIKFKLFYTITDDVGAVTSSGSITSSCQEMNLHVTDVQDYFVTSCNNLFTLDLPDNAYTGMYTITIDRIEAYVSMIDTLKHLVEPDLLNPYYQFTKTNTKIMIQHESILNQTPDEVDVCIGSCDVNKSFNYHSNITTRFKCSFRAYLSDFAVSYNTFDIWSSLYEPTTTEMLQNDIDEMKTTIETMQLYETALNNRITVLETKLNNVDTSKLVTDDILNNVICKSVYGITNPIKYEQNKSYTTGQHVWLKIGEPYVVNETFVSDNTENNTVEQSFESDITNNKISIVTT